MRCGAPTCRCLPSASLPPARPCPSGSPAFSPCCLSCCACGGSRALRVSAAHLFATPALPPLALTPCHVFSPLPTTSPRPFATRRGVACTVLSEHYCPLSLPLLYIFPSIPLVDFTYALLRCPYPFPWSQVVPECLLPWPTNVDEFRVARLRRVAHGASGLSHPWPALAAPSERWPPMRPTALPPHNLWYPGSGQGTFQGGPPCIGAITLHLDPARVHAG